MGVWEHASEVFLAFLFRVPDHEEDLLKKVQNLILGENLYQLDYLSEESWKSLQEMDLDPEMETGILGYFFIQP